MYQVWCLEPSEVSKVILWSKWKDFCKPQANDLRARYNLSKIFSQAGSLLMNDIKQFKAISLMHLISKSHKPSIQRYISNCFTRPGLSCYVLVRSQYRIGFLPKLGRWQKDWKVVGQLPDIWGVCLQASPKHKSINWGIIKLTWHNTKRMVKEETFTPGQVNLKLIQARNSNNMLPVTKTSFKPI